MSNDYTTNSLKKKNSKSKHKNKRINAITVADNNHQQQQKSDGNNYLNIDSWLDYS